MNWNDMIYILPEVILTIGASVMLLVPVTGGRGAKLSAKWMMLVLLAITAGTLIYCSHAVENIDQSRQLQAMFALDGFSIFFKLLFIGAIAMLVMLSEDFLAEGKYSPWEYYSLLGFRALRHDVHGLGRPPHHDLHRPRAALALELHPGRLLQERAEIDRSGDEVLHPRRRQLGDSAVRNLADLRRLRIAQPARHRRGHVDASSPTTR